MSEASSSPAPFHVVIALIDGSEPSMRALGVADQLARRQGLPLELLSVVEPGQFTSQTDVGMFEAALPAGMAPPPGRAEQKAKREALDKALAQLGPQRVVTETLLEGRAAETLLRHLDDRAGALVVLGRTGKSAFTRVVKGSVASAMATYCAQPVVIVP
jgi:nucleotide-binding universal stress UspA family protein